jgi:hypothetical protein
MGSSQLEGRSTSTSICKKYRVPDVKLSPFLEKLNALNCFVAQVSTPDEHEAIVTVLVPEFYLGKIPDYADERPCE